MKRYIGAAEVKQVSSSTMSVMMTCETCCVASLQVLIAKIRAIYCRMACFPKAYEIRN